MVNRPIAYFQICTARERDTARAVLSWAQYGLGRDASLVVKGNSSQKQGFEATVKLLSLANPPTAIFAANDLTAFGAIAAIREAGLRAPDEISVVGFDGVPMASQFYPPLTTVRQPPHQIGRSAVNTLLVRIAGLEPASPQAILPTELIFRASTAPCRPRT